MIGLGLVSAGLGTGMLPAGPALAASTASAKADTTDRFTPLPPPTVDLPRLTPLVPPDRLPAGAVPPRALAPLLPPPVIALPLSPITVPGKPPPAPPPVPVPAPIRPTVAPAPAPPPAPVPPPGPPPSVATADTAAPAPVTPPAVTPPTVAPSTVALPPTVPLPPPLPAARRESVPPPPAVVATAVPPPADKPKEAKPEVAKAEPQPVSPPATKATPLEPEPETAPKAETPQPEASAPGAPAAAQATPVPDAPPPSPPTPLPARKPETTAKPTEEPAPVPPPVPPPPPPPPPPPKVTEVPAKAKSSTRRPLWAKEDVYVRAAPDFRSRVLDALSTGDKVDSTGDDAGDGWLKVARGGEVIGYVSARFLTDKDPRGPSPKSTTGGATPSGKGGYAKASGENRGCSLPDDIPENRKPSIPVGTRVRVLADANLRVAPACDAKVLDVLDEGSTVTVMGGAGDWVQVGRDGRKLGYVGAALLGKGKR